MGAHKTFLLDMLRRFGRLEKNPIRHQVLRGQSIEPIESGLVTTNMVLSIVATQSTYHRI